MNKLTGCVMSNFSMGMDGARAILSTYRDVYDVPQKSTMTDTLRSQLNQKNKHLASELNTLKEKYLLLQRELINRDKKVADLNGQLVEKTLYITRLQEDFENAIEQLGCSKKQPL
jgi:hypothetical protein